MSLSAQANGTRFLLIRHKGSRPNFILQRLSAFSVNLPILKPLVTPANVYAHGLDTFPNSINVTSIPRTGS